MAAGGVLLQLRMVAVVLAMSKGTYNKICWVFGDILLDRVVYVVISCVSKLCVKLTAGYGFLMVAWLHWYGLMITILCIV